MVSIELIDPDLSFTFSLQTNVFTISVTCQLSQAPVFDYSLLDISPIVHVFGVQHHVNIPTITQVPACGFLVASMSYTPDLADTLKFGVQG